ncbi:MAG: DUF5004 domain-containing protein [Bacteroidales bacterium]|nr:DUF5004 domain-containing protein [Bacteroidales bacterium]
MKKIYNLLALAFIAFAMFSCGNDPKPEPTPEPEPEPKTTAELIVGTWQLTDGSATVLGQEVNIMDFMNGNEYCVMFNADGTATAYNKADGVPETADSTWSYDEETNSISMTVSGTTESLLLKSIDETTMVVEGNITIDGVGSLAATLTLTRIVE